MLSASCGKKVREERVYNLQVEGEPEYFANFVLVHNCVIALALAWSFCVVPLAVLSVTGVDSNPLRSKPGGGGVPVLVGDALSVDSRVPDLGSAESFYSYR